jgi:hypothetical protein
MGDMPIMVSESASFLFSSVTRENRKVEESAVGEQRHCGETMSGQGNDFNSTSGYTWWDNIYSNY